jgi:hypothetical protein
MTSTETSSQHTIKIVTVCNGGSKASRAVCSCGFLGSRVARTPGPGNLAAAMAKAEAYGAEHLAEMAS